MHYPAIEFTTIIADQLIDLICVSYEDDYNKVLEVGLQVNKSFDFNQTKDGLKICLWAKSKWPKILKYANKENFSVIKFRIYSKDNKLDKRIKVIKRLGFHKVNQFGNDYYQLYLPHIVDSKRIR